MFEVIWTKKARRCYERLDKDVQCRFERMLDILEKSPFYYGKSIKRLKGSLEGLYRFRIGKLRVFYTIDTREKVAIIINIDVRGNVY